MEKIILKEADRVEITSLVDNFSDLLLADTDTVKRLRVPPPDAPLAEHGLSCLITVYNGKKRWTVLMDAGVSGTCLVHNGAMLASSRAVMDGVVRHKLEDVQTLILSHGHFDHFSGIRVYLASTGTKIPVVVHPGAFVSRRHRHEPESAVPMPSMAQAEMEAAGAVFDKRTEASTIAAGHILVSGQVARVTDFEKGSPELEACIEGEWVTDPFEDDQGLAVKLKGKGLVVVSGCAHSGIINIVEHARRITGTEQVHAVMGGFHLSGKNEGMIEPTLLAMKAVDPDIVVPMHCTGWKAYHRFASEMPGRFILNCVGTTYVLGG